jgi:uncharacterized alkaline shock family protein YloU
MNIFNRLVVVLELLVLATAAGLLLTFLGGLVSAEATPFPPAARDWLDSLAALGTAGKVRVALLGLLALVVALLLLAFEVFPATAGQWLRMLSRQGERLTVDRSSVQKLAERTARDVEGVLEFRATVKASHGGVSLRCLAVVEGHTPLVDLGKCLQERVVQAVRQGTGLAVSSCDIRMTLAPAGAEGAVFGGLVE